MPKKRKVGRPIAKKKTGGRRKAPQKGRAMNNLEYDLAKMDRLATWADKVFRHNAMLRGMNV